MEDNIDKTGSPEGKNRTFKDLLQLSWRYLVSLVRIQEDTDIEATIANINKGVNLEVSTHGFSALPSSSPLSA